MKFGHDRPEQFQMSLEICCSRDGRNGHFGGRQIASNYHQRGLKPFANIPVGH